MYGITDSHRFMQNTVFNSKTLTISKPHFKLLDGLRGVAALMVIWYHVFEAFATSAIDQKFNHGYLAVDFFFVLSGFVIGYAYDDRWKKGLTLKEFLLRRIIRLQPMVIMGVCLGAIAFVIQGCVKWDGTPVATSAILLSLLLGLFMIPAIPASAAEIRGNGEMFPLNGPSWSLFFEYIGSILYGIILHRLSKRWLTCVVIISALCLAASAIFNMSGSYHLGMGWTLMDHGFIGGFLRLSYSFSIGLLMSRGFKPIKVRGAFWICSITLIILFCIPYVGATESMLNGIFDSVCTIIIFPLLIYIGASGATTDSTSSKICEILGNVSYPVYIIHYPFMYLFYAWVWNNGYTFGQVWPVAVGIFFGVTILAYAAFKLYDEPVRHRLTSYLTKSTNKRPQQQPSSLS